MLSDIHADLCTIYAANHFGQLSDSLLVTEQEEGATVRFVTLKTGAILFQIHNSFLKAGGARYDNNGVVSSCDLGHDCDGACLVEKDEQIFLVLLEMKSSYKRSHLIKAKKQFLSSYHNLISELYGLTHFDLAKVKICCMLASHPLTDEFKTMVMKWKNSGFGLDGYHKRALHYLMHPNEYTLLKSSEDPIIDTAPIRTSHLFKEVPLFHLAVPADTDSATFDIDGLLNKI